MGEFMCLRCGEEFMSDPKGYYYEQDVDNDAIYGCYTVKCPRCGRVHHCKEVFKWDGTTSIT